MKPCSNHKIQIALLALDELETRQARELRGHLDLCAGCRRYLDELSGIAKKLSARETPSDLETSESFHRKMMARLQGEEKVPVLRGLKAVPAVLNLRIALSLAAVLAAAALILKMQPRPAAIAIPPAPAPAPAPMAAVPAPTMANYRIAADQSMQAFDNLLNREGKVPLPPAPVYTVSMLSLAEAPE